MGRSVEQLANQQVLRWLNELQRNDQLSSALNSAESQSRVRPAQHPMITISRQYGAYGAEVGKIVARELGIDFHAQEIVHEIAARTDVRKQVVEALDERTQTRLQLWVDQLFQLRRFQSSDYIRALGETVLAIARHSSGVLVGRGAHLILEPRRTLRVRVYAPLERRIQFVAQREGMDELEARLKIQRIDDERRRFFDSNFNTDINDIESYDLAINTGTLSLEAAGQVIAESYRQRFG